MEVQSMARRVLGVAFGLGTQVLFAWTVWQLFFFLRDGKSVPSEFSPGRDLLLAGQFCIPHSLLLWPPFACRLKRVVPPVFYGNLFCVVTCVSLLILFRTWSFSPRTVWECTGSVRVAVQAGFLASWLALLYSLSLTGLGYQTGWTPWWHWFRHRPLPRRDFRPRGAYRWMRHPVYLSFLGLIWFTPRMTWDHVLLTALWTAYIFIGSYLKDERLAFYLGDNYRSYQASVAGFPLFPSWFLGRRRRSLAETAAPPVGAVPRQRAA